MNKKEEIEALVQEINEEAINFKNAENPNEEVEALKEMPEQKSNIMTWSAHFLAHVSRVIKHSEYGQCGRVEDWLGPVASSF